MNKAIEVQDQAVMAALTALRDKVDNMSPVALAIGEDMAERIKGRFGTATAPDGTRWKSNAQVTLMNYLNKKGGAFSPKTGKILAKGQQLAASKRPLQGESGDLARQIVYEATGSEVTVGSTMIYAAMQHFGGKKSEFPKLWGDIPARPFLPVTSSGELYPSEVEAIVDQIRQYLAN
jgi:phage gpG-like protein